MSPAPAVFGDGGGFNFLIKNFEEGILKDSCSCGEMIMNFFAKLISYFPKETGGFSAVGFCNKLISADRQELAQNEAQEWIRRNRLSNAEHPDMRFRVELFVAKKCVWSYDETTDDPVLKPTDETRLVCKT